MKPPSSQSGFTLVELTMVLLIIGILLGGVLQVEQLIENAKVNRLINDLEAFKTSYYSYYGRKGEFPGNATTESRAIVYDAVGTADGTFFEEISDEGFITSDEPQAELVAPGFYFATFLPTTDAVGLLTGTILGKNQACVTALDNGHARHLDLELDDGVWNRGIVRTTADFDALESHTLCLEI